MTYPKVYVTGHKQKNISGHPICMTDSDYDYILKEIICRETIEFEKYVEVYSDYEEN